jgi:hypothetical protein
VALGDPPDRRQRVRRQHRDRDVGVLGGGPEPVERAVLQPAAQRLLQEPVTQPEHARLAPPARNPRAGLRPVQRQRPHDREPAGIGAHRRESHLGRAWVPARRMDDRGVDAAFIHQTDGLLGGERRDLTMRQVARQATAPDVDLGIDDLHRSLSSHCLPSASGAVPARRPQGPSGGEAVLHDPRQCLPTVRRKHV